VKEVNGNVSVGILIELIFGFAVHFSKSIVCAVFCVELFIELALN